MKIKGTILRPNFEPKFKVGDTIKEINSKICGFISESFFSFIAGNHIIVSNNKKTILVANEIRIDKWINPAFNLNDKQSVYEYSFKRAKILLIEKIK